LGVIRSSEAFWSDTFSNYNYLIFFVQVHICSKSVLGDFE